MYFYDKLNQLMCQDIGHRGLLTALPQPFLEEISYSLSEAQRVILLTGFPVSLDGETCVGETDGPSGTANLAAAFTALSCHVTVVTDQVSYPLLLKALSYRSPGTALISVPNLHPEIFARELIDQINPTHVIFLERPGKGQDGHFHNMRGEVIDHMVTDTDEFLLYAKKQNIVTISIGDGGNELGMGTFRDQIKAFVPSGETICAIEASRYTLAAGVSNWWGWGISAILSTSSGQLLLPTEEEETQLLRAVLEAGAVDGCTREATMSVDQLSLETHLHLLNQVRQLTARAMLCDTEEILMVG